MNPWLLIVPVLDMVRRLFTVKDPPRTDKKPVDLNPKPPEKPK